tara:strand:+ start:11586 stop:11819 length:234 start_codon:yes stop_codon:yes gene_type:complete
MEIIEEQLIALAILLLRKSKIEEKLRQTFKCMLRKMFSCCGMKNIEQELIFLNKSINEIKTKSLKKNKNKLTRYSSI